MKAAQEIFSITVAFLLLLHVSYALEIRPDDPKEAKAKENSEEKEKKEISLDLIPTQSVDMSYVLLVNDFVHVVVYDEPELCAATRISQEGYITLSLIGNIKVGGLTIREAAEAIQAAYQKAHYLKNPRITITLVEFSKKRFYVLGEVVKPDSYEIPPQENCNLIQAISMAGGFKDSANATCVTVKRIQDDKEVAMILNVKAMAENASTPVFNIQPNDTITVPELVKKRFHVLGEVPRPGSYEIPPFEDVSLPQAISMAGGYTDATDLTSIIIKRAGDNEQESTIKLDARAMAEDEKAPVFKIQPNDTITVVKLAKKRFNILGEVVKPDSYEIPPKENVSLLQAISMAGGFTHLANPSRVMVKRFDGNQETTLELNAKAMSENKDINIFMIQPNDIIIVKASIF